jgi:thioredoxin reductase (NADPH)
MRSSIRSFILCIAVINSGYSAPKEEVYPVVVLGGGIAALTSSLYLGRADLSPVVIEGKTPGGLLTQSHSVQNWPGEMEIEGLLLTEKMREQAEANGVQFLAEEVVAVDFSHRPFVITTRSLEEGSTHQVLAHTCIIAMGTEPNYLHIPGETGPNGYWGRGVTNCAICDGNLYRNRSVAVVGGGDAAVLEALYLSNIAKEVSLLVRKEKLKATEQKRVEALLAKPNVKILYNTELVAIRGNGKNVTSVKIKSAKNEVKEIGVDGVFLAIGSQPNTALFRNQLGLDSQGYIVLVKGQETTVHGVYAVGDIVDPVYKQAISAAGDGAKAALQAQQYVSDRLDGLVAKRLKKTKEEPPHVVALTLSDEKVKISQKKMAPLMGDVIEIRSVEQFKKELAESDIPVLVDFYASWCGPCKRVSPVLDTSAAKLKGKVKFLKVNVDTCQKLTQQYEIRSMPTVLLFDTQGVIIDRKTGFEEILRLLEDLETR